jgi:hypothetical protein
MIGRHIGNFQRSIFQAFKTCTGELSGKHISQLRPDSVHQQSAEIVWAPSLDAAKPTL